MKIKQNIICINSVLFFPHFFKQEENTQILSLNDKCCFKIESTNINISEVGRFFIKGRNLITTITSKAQC